MEAPTAAQFLVDFPEFVDFTPETIQSLIDITVLSASTWGNYFYRAVELDIAHRLSIRRIQMAGPTGGFQSAAGPVTSVSAAGVSTSFGSSSAGNGKSQQDEYYQKTSYGQEFLLLRARVIAPGVLSGSAL